MAYLRMQRLLQILQDGTSSYDATLQVVDTETLQRLHLKVLVQLLVGGLFGKYPVVKFEGNETGAKIALKVFPTVAIIEHLLGLEVANQLFHIVVGAFARQEFTCRDIEEGHTAGSLAKVDSTEEIVFLVVEHRILHGHTRGHQFCDTSLNKLLRQFGVFQLVADGHSSSCPYELRQIGVQGVMRESGHFIALHPCPIIAMGQCDAQYLCGNDGIVAIRLVEVATAKQQQGLRVFCLEVEELFHHRSHLLAVFLCHSAFEI